MDAREIVEIPDTPDRTGRRKRDGCSLISSSEDIFLVGEDVMRKRVRNDSALQNHCEERFIHRRRGINISEPNSNGRGSVVSAHRHSSFPENASLFRKVGNSNSDGRNNINSQHADSSKDVHLKCSSKQVNHPEHNTGKFVIGGNTHRPQCVLNESKASKSKDLLANNSMYGSEDPLKAKINPNKGKGKINDDAFKSIPGSFDQQKSFSIKDDGSEQKLSSQVSIPVHSGTSPRIIGRKRLVRNGCISPLNIAKVKSASESSSNSNRGCASINEMTKVDSSIVINVDEELSNGRKSSQAKGKDIVTHPSSGERYTRPRDLNKSLSSANTLRRLKKSDPPVSSQDRDEEIIFIGSRSSSSSSGSHAERNQRRPCALDAVIEIDEHSPNVGSSNSQSNNDLAVQAEQLEADEMLARELQEQLYHEVPEIGNSEIDSHLAWRLQQEENVQRAPRSRNTVNNIDSHLAWMLQQEDVQQAPRSRNIANPRVSSSSQLRRQSRSQIFRNRFRPQPQASPRINRLRSRLQHTTGLFPSEMDLEARIEMLEALEAVTSDSINRANQLLNRDFTESDYDMLLALDENNHEHLGASNALISNLPECILQTNSTETCSICLEEPSIGETIRHLPCLHKFHKDCIDSWLRRKRTCPVCKSDIT